jgi:hypothetical protein
MERFWEVGSNFLRADNAPLGERAAPGRSRSLVITALSTNNRISRSVPYFLMGRKIAVCHRYVLPDGRIGASGPPDPKLPEYQGHILFRHSVRCPCPICAAPPENCRLVIEEMEKGRK